MQAAYADEFIRQISEVLGKEAVQNLYLYTQNFMDELAEKIRSLIPADVAPSKEDKKQLKLKIKKQI